MKKLLIFLLILFLAAACSWENEDTFYSDMENCDTLDVSYSMDIVPVLSSNCYSCHSNSNAADFGSGIALEDYADVNASSSFIVAAIKHLEGVPAMPRNSDKLDDCTISKIEAWVNDGSPEN
jgi:hypothetical protein